MEKILVFLERNKEWIFSGCGMALVGGSLSLIFSKSRRPTQSQKSGNNSINLQASGNLDASNINILHPKK